MTQEPAAAARPVGRAGELAAGLWPAAVRAWERAPVREPWRVLGPLLAVHWIALVLFVLSVHRNGWLFYQGGDQIWYWTSSWLLGHGSITLPNVSYGWPVVLLPFSWIAGPSFLSGLPPTVLLQVLVLAPIALFCVYDIAARIGGRVIGYFAALAWTIGPYLAIPLFVHRYHEKFVDEFLPHPLGLTAMADYPATVLVLAAAALGLRALQNRDLGTAAVAGLAAGLAGGMKPSMFLFPAVFAIAVLLALRWREALAFGIGLAPGIGTLALWKYQGFGWIPVFHTTYQETRVALSSHTLLYPYNHYVHVNWQHLRTNQLYLAKVFFSMRVLEFAPLAGAIAVARRSRTAAVLLSFWFWAFVILKGSADVASVEAGSFWRLLLPAAPALVVLLAALPLLVPRLGPALADRFPAPAAKALSKKTIALAAVALGLVPLAAVAAVRPLRSFKQPVVQLNLLPVPVVAELGPRAHVTGKTIRLTWHAASSAGGDVFYHLFRVRGKTDLLCVLTTRASAQCIDLTYSVLTTRTLSAVDRPGRGTWTYRIGVAANWRNDSALGDVFLVSKPVTVTAG
jgi:hypothetical protein